ncbi:sensor histidine kinase [Streptomyces sp. HK10]|uniref:sensor histidine kinase n=1 Tax=Streptomyces sp. HK10 TaxID=3373255 RepID=UPI00374A11D7
MGLGLAGEKSPEGPQAAARMVDEAHGEVKLALSELRDLARGIHPAILTDRGPGPALSNVAARCPAPVTVSVDLPTRPAPAIEGIACFTVSEILRNVGKHSGAARASVDLCRSGDRLLIRVADDGRGRRRRRPRQRGGGEARRQHLPEAGPGTGRRGPPPGAGRADVPQVIVRRGSGAPPEYTHAPECRLIRTSTM